MYHQYWHVSIFFGCLFGLSVIFVSCTDSKTGKTVANTTEKNVLAYTEEPEEKKNKNLFHFLEPLASVWGSDADSVAVEETADSLISQNVVEFTSHKGDNYRILFKCFTRDAPLEVAQIFAQPNCNFTVDQKAVLNTIVNITAYRNDKLFFSRDISKNDFKEVVDQGFLKTHQLVGADLFTFNDKLQQCIFRLNLAQRMGGTEWFAQVYYVINEAGKLITKGLCDYPFHCQDIMSLSADGKYLLTCSEIVNLSKTQSRKTFKKKKSVVLSKFINDSLFTLVYDTMRDSVICDTTIYWRKDTLTYQHKISIPDTSFNNAYIVHVKGDTIAKFPFKGFVTGTDGYHTQYSTLSKLNMIGYFDRPQKTLRIFDLDNGMKQKVYSMYKLDYIALSPNYDSFFEFNTVNDKGKNVRLRFFVNNNKKIVGYTYI